jgi:hypothetical protein
MKLSTNMVERLAEVGALDLDALKLTPEELIELGVELVLIGTQKIQRERRTEARSARYPRLDPP